MPRLAREDSGTPNGVDAKDRRDRPAVSKTVFLACGGTGGHIFPAFSVAEELEGARPELIIRFLCGNKDIEETIFRKVSRDRFSVIDSAPFRGLRSFADPVFLLKLMRGFWQSVRLVRRNRPSLVVGFGGHFSFPVIVAAKLMGVRTLIHEQNVMPGSANRWMSRWVDGAALSFESTKAFLKLPETVRVTGNPIRASIERDCAAEALDFFDLSKHKVTVLVVGGSQGAESINRLFLGSLKFLNKDIKREIQVLHLCGRMDPGAAQEACRASGVSCRAFSFFDRMDLVYSMADLALGRAGATFLAEIKNRKIPAILVPYPYGDGHQRVNARAFAQECEADIVEQSELDELALAELLEKRVMKTKTAKQSATLACVGSAMNPAGSAAGARELLADFICEMADAPQTTRKR